ncbi:MAG: polysaccharide deacetylase family protein [Labilithrix sp.]|nr:polysaccharide deacetylase family protein [Labilithrix sp.]
MATYRFISGFVAFAAITTLVQCSSKGSKTSPSGKTCSGTQALQSAGLRGSSMAPKSLALTFDDGPGPRTKQLSLYLKNQGIEAAFFVNGRSMGANGAEILQALVDDGHLVANHTETHQSLTGTPPGPRPAAPEVVRELTDTDVKIDPFIPSKRFLFRPPFGDYDDTTFAALSDSPMNKYVGPILWDVGDRLDEAAGRGADWDCWQDGTDAKRTPMKTCGDLYLTEIRRESRGIVLLHDPYFNEQDPELQGTVDMVQYMVPILKAEGFTFVRVDKVPEIASLLPPLPAEEVDAGGPAVANPGEEPSPEANGDPCP